MSLLFDGATRERRNRWAALAALYLAMFMNILDVSVVNLALPSIRRGLGATDTQLEWVLVVYVLAFAAGLLPFGRFGDVVGRGRSSAGVSPGLPPVPWHAVWRLI